MAGRPSKLTKDVQASILRTLAACGTFEDACGVVGISQSTFHAWRAKGRAQRRGVYREFLDSLDAALRKRRVSREAQILAHGKKDWRAIAWVLERTEPTRYAPRVRIYVEQELNDAIDRLKEAFRDNPEALERALHALAGGDGGAGVEGAEGGEGSADNSDGETVLAVLPQS